jgi:hypothetical protein
MAATLAEFAGNASPSPAHLDDVHFAAAGADALHLRLPETLDLRQRIEFLIRVLQGLMFAIRESIRFMPCHCKTPQLVPFNKR